VIVFDLRCARSGHVFEAWFGSGTDYDDQQARGLVACPICGHGEVAKAPMSPRVPAKGNQIDGPPPAAVKKMLAELASAQKQALEKSEHVGDRFPAEARAIHLGEAEARAIHGRASLADARDLADEGVPVSALPFPVPDPKTEN